MLPQVLMLGWEYPPHINGGLGVASQGIARSISQYLNLQLFIPNALGVQKTAVELAELVPFGFSPDFTTLPVSLEGYAPYQTGNVLYQGNLALKVARYRKTVWEVAQSRRFDLVHAHDWMTFPAAMQLQKKLRKPMVLHVHSTEYDRSGPQAKNWVYRLEKEAFQKADLIVPVSQYTARIIEKEYEIPARKISPVHNAIRLQKGIRLPKPFPEKLVVFMGRITGMKGPEQFLNMSLKVLEHVDRVRFMVAGVGDQRGKLMRLAAKARIGDRFHCVGFLDAAEKQRMLGMADVFVMPSLSEPFGLVALEAAQMGVPCLISENSGVKEVLKGAIEIDPLDRNQMAHYVISLLNHPRLAKTVSLQQKKNMEGQSWDAAAMKLISLYQQQF